MAQKKAIFNNGQQGSLPPVSVVRDTAKQDIVDGGEIAINTPAYGHISRRCKFSPWTIQNAGTQSYYLPTTGYDMDGETPMAMGYHAGLQLLTFWVGTELDTYKAGGGLAVLDINLRRVADSSITVDGTAGQNLIDIMHGAGAGDTLDPNQATQAHRPQCAVCLPGCYLVLCGKQVDQGSDVWDTEGMSLIAIQSDGNGGFTRHWIGDHVGDTVPFASGRQRGREWSMTTYFPFTHMQNPCLRAFIPYTDYIYNTPLSIGGQLGIIEATRADIDSPWVFGGLYHIYEKIETQVHFHTAAWTPRGVVLSQGDNGDLNENPLFTCDDWDDYTNGSNWTHLTKNYGSGNYGAAPQHNFANQWAGASPSRIDPNRWFCAADVDPDGIWSGEVLENLTQRYVAQWGYTHANDTNDHLALDFSGPCKEIQPGMCVAIRNQLSSTTLRGKVVAGTEEEGFAAIARMPVGIGASGLCRIYDRDVYAFNRGGAGPSLYKIPRPAIEEIRGLSVGPGGFNRLKITTDSPPEYDRVTALGGGPSTTIEIIEADVGALGSTPVYDLLSAGTHANNQIFRHYIADAATAYAGFATYVALWVRSMDAKLSVPLRLIIYNTGGSNLAFHVGGVYTGIEVGDWKLMIFTLEEGGTPPTDPNDGVLRWEAHTSYIMPFHYQLQIQGVYSGPQCPYLIAPNTTSSNEEVEQPLTTVGDSWTVGIELHVPKGGEDFDYAAQSIKTSIALATLYVDSDNYIEITADITNEEVDFAAVVGGVPLAVKSLSNFSLCRDTTIQLGITFDGSDFVYFGACGGLTETGLENDTVTGDIGAPASVRIGNNDFTEVPNTELNMVALDDNAALTASQFLDMMAKASEDNKFGPRIALDWFKDRLVTEIN